MHLLETLLNTHAETLATLTGELAGQDGFAHLAGAQDAPWTDAMGAINTAMIETLKSQGLDGCTLSAATDCKADSTMPLAFRTAREHGLAPAMFMALLKFYRRACTKVIADNITDDQERCRAFVTCFFDRMELALCRNWDKSGEAEAAACFVERSRFMNLFDSLGNPVFMVGNGLEIEAMNRAAADFLRLGGTSKELAYALCDGQEGTPAKRVPLADVLPWLTDEIHTVENLKEMQTPVRFDVTVTINFVPRCFDVSISNLTDASGTCTGHTVVLDDITFRKETEERLSKERNRAAHYLDVVGSMVMAMDASGGVTLINKAGCDILGYTEFELLGQNWVDKAVPPEQREEVRDYLYHIISDEVDMEDEHISHVATKDGELRLISWNTRLLRNDGGLPIGILSSGIDITEQRAMEDALAEKEVWLRNTFIALSESVIILTPERQIIDINPAAEKMFQMTAEEAQDQPATMLHVDMDHYERFGEITQKAFEKGEAAEFEYVLRRTNGAIFPTEHSVSLITGDDGSPLGIVSVCRDISRRKEAEQNLRRSEEKFRRIFQSIEEGYMVTDMAGVIQMINPATCRLLGYDEEELVGKEMGILFNSPEERARLTTSIQTKGAVRGFHLTAVRKDGSTIITEANAHMVFNPDDTPLAMEGTFRDITARIEAEKILREREKQYRAFFENNHAIMLLVDPKNDDIVDANPAAGEFYGYSTEEMRSMRMTDIQAQSAEEIYQEMFRARDEERVYFLFRHKLKSGEIRDVEVYSGPIMVRGNQLLYSVIHDVTTRIRLEREMKRMATTDALTGVQNRHQFFLDAGMELKRSQRYGHPLAVIMLDIDYFKSINDTYGHHAGDIVLKELASLAKGALRETDILGRLGGEEFAFILPETPLEAGFQVAERLREDLEKFMVSYKKEVIQFTASMGVAIAKKEDSVIEDVINRADEALYKAKRMGRNRVVKS